MDIFSGKVRLIQKGVAYDLVEVHLFCVTVCYGLPGPPTEESELICKIPVERDEIVARLKQAQDQRLPLEVDESDHPHVETTGLGIGQARIWLKQSLCEHKTVQFSGVHDWKGGEGIDSFQCVDCKVYIFEDTEVFEGLNPRPERCSHSQIRALGWQVMGKDYFECSQCGLHASLNYRHFRESKQIGKEK